MHDQLRQKSRVNFERMNGRPKNLKVIFNLYQKWNLNIYGIKSGG